MPCYDGRDDIRYVRKNCNCEPFRTEAREATRAACDMRTILRRAGLEIELTEDTKKWIAAHDSTRERIPAARLPRPGRRRG
jgi:hypothetical protein